MKPLDDQRMKVLIVGFVAAFLIGGGKVKADFTFGEATTTPWPPTNTIGDERIRFSTDELTFYLSSDRADGFGGDDLYVCTRSTTDDPWSEPANLGSKVNSSSSDFSPVITSDGLELYFCSDRPGGYGSNDIWMTRRETKDSLWSQAVPLDPPTNGSTNVWALQSISCDDLEIFFVSGNIPGGYGGWDIWTIKRTTREATWGAPVNAGPNVNSAEWDGSPVLLADDLTLIFSSTRLGGFSTMSSWNFDLWMSRRETKDAPWGEAVNLGPSVNTEYSEMGRQVSFDGSMLYFKDRSWEGIRPGGSAGSTWQAPIIPIVDFNGDGFVNSSDMCIMVDYWKTDSLFCDVGPMPWGDGVVDVADLKVLAEHLFHEAYDPTLVAHWPLDETEGMVVADTVGDNQAFAVGDPVWQPDGGQVGGALLFDGVDDFISTPAVLNPTDGPFSVLVWVQGGAPGQGIISEANGPRWLSLDQTLGNLMTELASAGRSAAPLISQTAINDGNWHRIGLVWDGSNRILCVDEAIVAQDIQNGLDSTGNGLYIGCGDPLQADTFFSGLIDDIRIYNRAVSP